MAQHSAQNAGHSALSTRQFLEMRGQWSWRADFESWPKTPGTSMSFACVGKGRQNSSTRFRCKEDEFHLERWASQRFSEWGPLTNTWTQWSLLPTVSPQSYFCLQCDVQRNLVGTFAGTCLRAHFGTCPEVGTTRSPNHPLRGPLRRPHWLTIRNDSVRHCLRPVVRAEGSERKPPLRDLWAWRNSH